MSRSYQRCPKRFHPSWNVFPAWANLWVGKRGWVIKRRDLNPTEVLVPKRKWGRHAKQRRMARRRHRRRESLAVRKGREPPAPYDREWL